MSVTISDFSPTTKLSGGNKGLIRTKDKTSNATVTGTGLANGQYVEVLFPAKSKDPKYKWTGTTGGLNSETMECTVLLTQTLDEHGDRDKDDPATVSVTVGDSAATNFDTKTGTAP
jgi:hypothetical protein